MQRTITFFVGVALVIAVSFAFELIREAPPSSIVIATGERLGGYYRMGQKLAQRLKRHGIEVKVLETSGSVENLKLLTRPGGPDFAFVQGGARPPSSSDTSTLRTLASMDLEPVWIFSRAGSAPIRTIDDLARRQVVGGLDGSGTRDLLLRLFEAFNARALEQPIALSNAQAADAWLAGRGEALFSVALLDENPWLQPLFTDPQTEFVELDDAEALACHLPFMSTVSVPRSSLNLKTRVPRKSVHLLATTTNLVVTDPSHSAIKGIILQELSEVHRGTRSLGTLGKFPNIDFHDFPPDDEARNFFNVGPSIFRQHLPYWLATLVERFYAVILPVLAVVLPLSRFLPRWLAERRARRIDALFGEIEGLDHAIEFSRSEAASLRQAMMRLDDFDAEISRTRAASFGAETYLKVREALSKVRRRGEEYQSKFTLESAPREKSAHPVRVEDVVPVAHAPRDRQACGEVASVCKDVSKAAAHFNAHSDAPVAHGGSHNGQSRPAVAASIQSISFGSSGRHGGK